MGGMLEICTQLFSRKERYQCKDYTKIQTNKVYILIYLNAFKVFIVVQEDLL